MAFGLMNLMRRVNPKFWKGARGILRACVFGLFAVVSVEAFRSSAQATVPVTYTWNGGAGNWHTASNWDQNAVPGSGDKVVINGGTVTLASDATVAELTLSGGTLTGAAELTVTGIARWSGGILDGGERWISHRDRRLRSAAVSRRT